MLVRKKQSFSIFSVDNSSLRIVDIRRGNIQFGIKYALDINSAIRQDAYTITAVVSKKSTTKTSSYFGTSKTSGGINTSIRLSAASPAGATKVNEASKISESFLDLTTLMPNDAVSAVLKGGSLVTTTTAFTSNNAGTSTIDMSTAASADDAAAQAFSSYAPSPSSILNIITSVAVDPAILSAKSFPIQTPESSYTGVATNTTKYTLPHSSLDAEKITNSSYANDIMSSLVAGSNLVTDTTKASIGMPKQTTSKNSNGEIKFVCPLADLARSSKIYIVFSLINTTGRTVQRLEYSFNYQTLLNEFYAPILQPSITAKYLGMSKALITVGVSDRKIIEAQVYARPIDGTRQTQKTSWSKIATLKDKATVLVDLNPQYTQLLRVIGVGRKSSATSGFGSTALEVSADVKAYIGNTLSINETIDDGVAVYSSDNGLSIEITGIPSNAVAVTVLRKDETAHDSAYTIVPGTSVKLLGGSGNDFIINDISVADSHIYSYKCEYIDKYGCKQESLNIATAEYISNTFDSETLQVGPVTLGATSTGAVSASFEITAPIVPTTSQTTIASMFAGTVAATAVADSLIAATTEEVLYSYMVDRTNATTGEVESFGFFDTGMFVDDPTTRIAAGVSEPSISDNYTYSVTLCKRSPTSLIADVVIEDEDSSRGILFSRNHTKVANPMLQRGGAITSGRLSSVTSGYSVEAFDGRSGIVSNVKMTPTLRKTYMVKSVKVAERDSYNLISWEWTGSAAAVDHFLVMAAYGSVKAPIASVHSFSGFNNYHKDFELAGRCGTISYSVIPVLLNYSQGAESSAVSITKSSISINTKVGAS